MDKSKDAIIKDVYYQPNGYGSMKTTLEQARQKDKTITMDDIKAWFKQNVHPTNQLRGENSWIAPYANFEYECDLFFVTKPEGLEYNIGLLVIDNFSKFCSVILLKQKTPEVILPALERAFRNLGGTPEILYSDNEGALVSKELNEFYKKNNIRHIVTKGHAHTAERMVRTLKNMIFKRLKHEPDKTWYDIIHECLVTLNYTRKSSATKMTPNDAKDPKNMMKVKVNLERNRKDNRKYPTVKVGDEVRIYRRRKNFEKENQSIWSEKKYTIKEIEDVPNVGKLYHLDGILAPLLRSEILL